MITREDVVKWARKMHFDGAVVIDTEATGGAFQDEIFEIAVIRLVDSKVLFDQMFEPSRPVAWHSTKVHNFTTKDLKGYPKFPDYWEELKNIIDGFPVLAFNAPFDKRLVKQTCDRYNLDLPELEYHCIMQAYGKYVGRRTGLSLASVCAELNVEGGSHRALTDAQAATRVVQKLADDKTAKT